MAKLAPDAIPSYKLHKQSGQARVIFNGRGFLLGPFGSADSLVKYHRLVKEWEANDRTSPPARSPAPIAGPVVIPVADVVSAYWKHCQAYYATSPDLLRICCGP